MYTIWISQHRNYTNFKVGVPPLVLWITDLQASGFSSFRVLVFLLVPLSDPWFCESQTYKYLGFPSSSSRILARPLPYIFSPHNFPYKGVHLGWVDCGHKPPFSTIMKVGGGTTVYMSGRCIEFTPVTFLPQFSMAERFRFKVTGKKPKVVSLFKQSAFVSVNCLSCLRLRNLPLFYDISAICQASILDICPDIWYVCLCCLPLFQSSAFHLTHLCLRHLTLFQSSAFHLTHLCLRHLTLFQSSAFHLTHLCLRHLSALVSVVCLSSDMSSLDTTLFQSSFCHLTFIYF